MTVRKRMAFAALCFALCAGPSLKSFALAETLSNARGENPKQLIGAANPLQLNSCDEKTINFKTLEAQNYFLENCFDQALAAANPRAVKYSSDHSILAFGFKNFIFSKVNNQKFIITGNNSTLNDVQEILIDAKNLEVWALDGDRLLAFELQKSGNLSPRRGLQGKWIKGTTAAALDSVGNEIYLLNPKIQRVIVYDRTSDTLYRSDSKNLKPKREIYSESKIVVEAADLVLCANEQNAQSLLVLLSANKNSLSVFKANVNGWASSAEELTVSGALHPVAMTCAQSKLQILDTSGTISELSIPAVE